MRTLLYSLIILLFSCDNHQSENKNMIDNESDSIILKNKQNLQISDTITQLSDSVTTIKVNKVIKEIKYLTKYVEKLEIENIHLSKELKFSKENVRVDTVFIETKKNFWGKEKKTIKTNSNSYDVETIDTLSNNFLGTITINKY